MSRPVTWRTATFVLALAGVAVAGYLTYVHYQPAALFCTIGGCETVQTSKYATLAGVPIAILGLGMYLAVLALGIARRARPEWQSPATMGAFTLVLAGTLYAAYLTYLEIWVIKAICQWCVVSAILTLGILITEGVSLWRLLDIGPMGETVEGDA